jgi:hypothetical protein
VTKGLHCIIADFFLGVKLFNDAVLISYVEWEITGLFWKWKVRSDFGVRNRGPCCDMTTSRTIFVRDELQRQAVSWLSRLASSLLWWRLGFAPKPVHVGFVVEKVALRQVFLRVLRVSPVNVIPLWLHTYVGLSSGEWTIGPLVAAVNRRSGHPIDANNDNN